MAETFEMTPVARTLLASVPPEIRQTVLSAACPGLASALEKVKKRPASIKAYGVESALTIVNELRDRSVLEHVGRSDQRVSVQHALRAHPSKPSLRRRTGGGKGKRTGVEPLTFEGDVPSVLKRLEESPYVNWDQALQWARELPGEKDTAYRALLSYENEVYGDLLHDLHDGKVPGLSLEAYLGDLRGYRLTRAVSYLLQAVEGPIGPELAAVVAKHGDGDRLPDHDLHPEAAEIFLASGQDSLVTYAVKNADLTRERVKEAFKGAKGALKNAIVLASEDEDTVNDLLEELEFSHATGLSGGDPTSVLNQFTGLSTKARLSALRYASASEVTAWINGDYPNQPREGEGTALARDFLTERSGYATLADLVTNLDDGAEDGAYREVCLTLVNEGRGIVSGLLTRPESALAKLALERIVEALGDDRAAWEVAVSLLPDWTGTLCELLEVTGNVTGTSEAAKR